MTPRTDTFTGHRQCGPDWDPEYRPGDSKWAASVLALGASDGKIKWGYQYTQRPLRLTKSPSTADQRQINGEDRKLVVHAARTASTNALDRHNGSFVLAAYVDD